MSNKFWITALVASLVAFILGFLVYGIALESFFAGEMTTDVSRPDEEMIWWAMILGHLTWGFIMTYIIGKWAGISTFSSGAQAGALIGFFIVISFGLINYAVFDMASLTATIVDGVAAAVLTAITGGVIGWMMGRNKS